MSPPRDNYFGHFGWTSCVFLYAARRKFWVSTGVIHLGLCRRPLSQCWGGAAWFVKGTLSRRAVSVHSLTLCCIRIHQLLLHLGHQKSEKPFVSFCNNTWAQLTLSKWKCWAAFVGYPLSCAFLSGFSLSEFRKESVVHSYFRGASRRYKSEEGRVSSFYLGSFFPAFPPPFSGYSFIIFFPVSCVLCSPSVNNMR